MNNVSFQGKTQVIFNNLIYEKATTRHSVGAFTDLDKCMSDTCKLRNTRWIACNPNELAGTGVVLFNEKGGMFFRNAQNKMNEILECIDKFKTNAKNKLTAWIIGGQRGESTERTVTNLAEILCDRPDIDTSIIAGQKSISPNITFHPISDKLELNIGMSAKNQDELENALTKYYDIVELNNTSIA